MAHSQLQSFSFQTLNDRRRSRAAPRPLQQFGRAVGRVARACAVPQGGDHAGARVTERSLERDDMSGIEQFGLEVSDGEGRASRRSLGGL